MKKLEFTDGSMDQSQIDKVKGLMEAFADAARPRNPVALQHDMIATTPLIWRVKPKP